VNGDGRITLRVRYYHKSVFSPTFYFILKMSNYALHKFLHFRRTNPPYVKLKYATHAKLINDVGVNFHLETGNVCNHMLVKCL